MPALTRIISLAFRVIPLMPCAPSTSFFHQHPIHTLSETSRVQSPPERRAVAWYKREAVIRNRHPVVFQEKFMRDSLGVLAIRINQDLTMTAILERRESTSLWGRFCNWITSTDVFTSDGSVFF